MDYCIVEELSKETIMSEVNSRLNDGYELVGGLSVTMKEHGALVYSQAMARPSCIPQWRRAV